MSITSPGSPRIGDACALTENEGAVVQNGSCSCSYDGELGRITRLEDGRRLIPKKDPNRVEGDFAEDIERTSETKTAKVQNRLYVPINAAEDGIQGALNLSS